MDKDHLGARPKKLRAGATVVFVDESGFSLTPVVARTWSPAGQASALTYSFGRWEKLSAISGIAVRLRRGRIETEMFFRLKPGKTIAAREAADFLRGLSRHLRGKVVIIWDNAGQHRGPAVRSFFSTHERFVAVPLPPYCPELNPDEDVWSWVKSKDLANLCALDDEDLVRHVRGSLRRMQRRPKLLEGALRWSELPWGRLLK